MNKSQANNNPLNLRYAHQTESTGPTADGFAYFENPMAGWRAAHAQIKLDQSRGITLARFITKFAPPSENDTEAYLKYVCIQLGVLEGTMLAAISPFALAGVMAAQEGYYNK